MYPLAHLYFAQKALPKFDHTAVLGSVFPDLVIAGGIEWQESHTLGMKMWKHFRGKGQELVNFTLGVISHGVEPRGLDYYSDEKYGRFERGYCYEKARPLVDSVVEACNISSEDGWWKAHNFIEMGIELYIFERRSELLTVLQEALSRQDIISFLNTELSALLGREKEELEKGFILFESLFAQEEPLDARVLAMRYQKQIYYRHNIESIDVGSCRKIIEKSRLLIEDDIEDFFNSVCEQMVPVWRELAEQ